ncbi:MAG: sigma-70 family RNA polymerase sigma factor [Planctomycetota bacterium]
MKRSEALDEVVRNASALRALARALAGDPAAADDAVQQAGLVALLRPPMRGSAVAGWMRAVVQSCVLDRRRAEHRRARRERRAARPEASDQDDPARVGEHLELQQEVLAAVGALAEPYRTTIWLRYFEELRPQQIAARTGVPPATVKMRLWRALHLLRQRLDRRCGRARWLAALLPLRARSAAGLGTVVATGALLMPKKIALTVLVVALLLVGIRLAWTESGPPATSATPTPAATSIGTASSEPAPPTRARVAAAEPVATETTAAPGGDHGALSVHVRWHDGTAAVGITVLIHAVDEPQSDRADVRVVTDAEGRAAAAVLHAGTVELTSDRGGETDAEVVPGRETEVEFVLPRGLDVCGVVVDGRQQPIGGAQIVVVSDRLGWLGGNTVAHSSADGTFFVRSVDPAWSIGARADGHAPSDLVDLETLALPADAATADVRLQITSPGATIAGRVTDDRGEPVAGASVAIGRCRPPTTVHYGVREHWSPELVVTDANGAFRCSSVAPGRQRMAVRASGHGTWTDEVECVTDTTRTVNVTLPRGVRVQGCVRLGNGTPVAGAVMAALAHPGDWRLSDSQRAQLAFPFPEVRSDEEGRFELHGVTPGELLLFARKRTRAKRVADLGTCRATLFAEPGTTVRWDPVLQPGRRIHVRVVDTDGQPISCRVEATAEAPAPGAELLLARPDAADPGLMVVTECADVAYTIAAAEMRPGRPPMVWRTGVRPDGPELELRLPPTPPLGSAVVRGHGVDSGGRVPAGKSLVAVLWCEGSMRSQACSGPFEFEAVDAGHYVVWLQVDDEVLAATTLFDVRQGQTVELGAVETAPAAAITVRLRAPAGLELGRVQAQLVQGNQHRALAWNGSSLHADNVSAGRHHLTLRGKGWLVRPRDVELIAGQDNRVEVEVEAGNPLRLEVRMPFPDRWRSADLRVRDRTGAVVAEYVGALASVFGLRPVAWTPSLPPGEYVFEAIASGATVNTGDTRRWPLTVPRVPVPDQTRRFSMR